MTVRGFISYSSADRAEAQAAVGDHAAATASLDASIEILRASKTLS